MTGYRTVSLAALLLLNACDSGEPNALDEAANGADSHVVEQKLQAEARTVMEPLAPPAPGTPGGLPAMPTPAIEGSITPDSAQGAAQVVQGYYALLEEQRFPEALKLWGDNGVYGQTDPAAFTRRFNGYSEIHANIGAPGAVDGGAGWLYVSVPVQIYARVKATGTPFYTLRTVTLRRVNNVDGSTEAQRRWHIARIDAFTPETPAPDAKDARLSKDAPLPKEKPAPSH